MMNRIEPENILLNAGDFRELAVRITALAGLCMECGVFTFDEFNEAVAIAETQYDQGMAADLETVQQLIQRMGGDDAR